MNKKSNKKHILTKTVNKNDIIYLYLMMKIIFKIINLIFAQMDLQLYICCVKQNKAMKNNKKNIWEELIDEMMISEVAGLDTYLKIKLQGLPLRKKENWYSIYFR